MEENAQAEKYAGASKIGIPVRARFGLLQSEDGAMPDQILDHPLGLRLILCRGKSHAMPVRPNFESIC